MNNKGFTLIELLAVFVILISVSLIAVFGINASLERNDEKELESQIELTKEAAKVYFSLNNGVSCVNLKTLINDKYIVDSSKINKLDIDASSVSRDNSTGNLTYNSSVCP